MRKLCATISVSIALSLSAPALSQPVYRCVEGGRTSYSQTPCGKGPSRKVNVSSSMFDSIKRPEPVFRAQVQNTQAGQEWPRKDAYVREEEESQRRRQISQIMAENHGQRGMTVSQREAIYRLDAAERGLPIPPAVQQHPAPTPPPTPPSIISSCDSSGCWDTGGGRYNATGSGHFYDTNGRFCAQDGPNIRCN